VPLRSSKTVHAAFLNMFIPKVKFLDEDEQLLLRRVPEYEFKVFGAN